MKSIFYTLLTTTLLVGCGGGGGGDSAPATNTTPNTPPATVATLPEQVYQYMDNQVDASQAGIIVLAKKDGEIVVSRAKGLAKIDGNVEISASTGFRLASVSKPFTGLAIMQLLEREQVNLEDDITTWLPELSDTYQGITLFQILTHTSGIKDFVNDINNIQRLDNWRNPDVISEYLNQETLEFTPGSFGQYSNTGYVLAALIVERATGINFADYMATEIFDPADMNDSYVIDGQFPANQTDALNYASTANIFGFTSLTNGSSSQVSSINDLENFVTRFRNNDLVSQESKDLMLQCHSSIGSAGNYGLGWQVQCDTDGEARVFSHGGSWDGFRTILYVDLRRDLEIIILSNGGSVTVLHLNQIFSIISDYY